MSESPLDEFRGRFEELLRLRQARDQKKTAAEKAEKSYREYEAEFWAELDEAGIKGRLTFDFGPELGTATFTRTATKFGRVINKAAAIQEFRKRGMEEAIIQEGVVAGRLNEFVRDELEAGNELPEGVDYRENKRIGISQGK